MERSLVLPSSISAAEPGIDRVYAIAAHYGVTIREREPGEASYGEMSNSSRSNVVPWKNLVLLGPGSYFSVDELLHEVAHCICYVPVFKDMDFRRGISQVDEGDFLMPFERQIGKACFDGRLLEMILEYQAVTSVWDIPDSYGCPTELGCIEDYENHPRWQRGIRIAQQVGLLDKAQQPTFEKADWTKVPNIVRQRLLNHI